MHREDSGVTAVEYALIIGLVAVVLIGAITILGGNVRDAFGTVACKIQGKTWSATANSNAGGCI
jgi:pilus assembly protein Flp/PilA